MRTTIRWAIPWVMISLAFVFTFLVENRTAKKNAMELERRLPTFQDILTKTEFSNWLERNPDLNE